MFYTVIFNKQVGYFFIQRRLRLGVKYTNNSDGRQNRQSFFPQIKYAIKKSSEEI